MQIRPVFRRRGFTMIEIIIGASVLSLFMLGLFSIYRSGSKSFTIGTWRAKAQKEAQQFLEQYRTILESSGDGLIPRDTQIDKLALPVRINNLANNTSYSIANLSAETVISFSSLTTPCTRYSSLASVRQPGTWMAGLLTASKRTLTLQNVTDPVNLPGSVMGWAPALGADWAAASSSATLMKRVLTDVDTVFMRIDTSGDIRQLTVQIEMTRPNDPSGARVTQSIRANLLKDMSIIWF